MENLVGFIGLGNMGAPMVRALATAGHNVLAYDLSEERRSNLNGVANVSTTDAVSDLRICDTVVLMLPNGNIVREVLIGESGLGAILPKGALVIDMSSCDPVDYPQITTALDAHNVGLIDAPVSGNVSGAEAGNLTIMAGGSDANVLRAKTLLEAMGKTIFHTGPLGSGQVMKALNNLLSAGGLIMAIEVLLVAKNAGLNPNQVNDILNVSTGRNNSTERKIAPFVLSGTYDSGFYLSLMAKDLRTAGAIAQRAGINLPLASHAITVANTADEALGDTSDHTEIARWLEEATGLKL